MDAVKNRGKLKRVFKWLLIVYLILLFLDWLSRQSSLMESLEKIPVIGPPIKAVIDAAATFAAIVRTLLKKVLIGVGALIVVTFLPVSALVATILILAIAVLTTVWIFSTSEKDIVLDKTQTGIRESAAISVSEPVVSIPLGLTTT